MPDSLLVYITNRLLRNPTTGCEEWQGSLVDGYGQSEAGGVAFKVHRKRYELEHGIALPRTVLVRHTCDNRKCARVDHLVTGTHRQNMQDRNERDRTAKGERNGKAKLTQEIAVRIRADTRYHKVIAQEFGISKSCVGTIKRGETWRDC